MKGAQPSSAKRGLGLFVGLEIAFLVFGFFAAVGLSHFLYGSDSAFFVWLAAALPTPFTNALSAAYIVAAGLFFAVGNGLVITVARGRRAVYGAVKSVE